MLPSEDEAEESGEEVAVGESAAGINQQQQQQVVVRPSATTCCTKRRKGSPLFRAGETNYLY